MSLIQGAKIGLAAIVAAAVLSNGEAAEPKQYEQGILEATIALKRPGDKRDAVTVKMINERPNGVEDEEFEVCHGPDGGLALVSARASPGLEQHLKATNGDIRLHIWDSARQTYLEIENNVYVTTDRFGLKVGDALLAGIDDKNRAVYLIAATSGREVHAAASVLGRVVECYATDVERADSAALSRITTPLTQKQIVSKPVPTPTRVVPQETAVNPVTGGSIVTYTTPDGGSVTLNVPPNSNININLGSGEQYVNSGNGEQNINSGAGNQQVGAERLKKVYETANPIRIPSRLLGSTPVYRTGGWGSVSFERVRIRGTSHGHGYLPRGPVLVRPVPIPYGPLPHAPRHHHRHARPRR